MGRSVKRYQNAAQLLPKPLLAELQNYAAGKMLYVPHRVSRREFNRLKVLDLRMQGYSVTQIAYRTGLSRRGVSKILQRDRERALTILQLFTSSRDEEDQKFPGERESGETPPSRRR
jgi:Mor family transcriptional regulator